MRKKAGCILFFALNLYAIQAQNIIRYSFAPGPGQTVNQGTVLYHAQLDAMRRASSNQSYNQPASDYKFTYTTRKQVLQAAKAEQARAFEAFVKESDLKDIKARTITVNNKPEVMDYYPRFFSLHLKLVTKNGKYGLYNPLNGGSLVFPIEYDYFSYPHQAQTAVCGKNGKFGLLSAKGDLLLPVEYDHILLFSNDLFLVEKDDKMGLTDISGKAVLASEYSEIQPLISGTAIVKNMRNQFGIIDSRGWFLMAPDLQYAEHVRDRQFIIARNNTYELFDLATWKTRSIYKYSSLIHLPFSKVLYGKVAGKNIHHFISYNGIPLTGDVREIKEMPEYPHGYYIKENNKWGVLDMAFEGIILPAIPAIYDTIIRFDLEKGVYVAMLDGKKVDGRLNVKGYPQRRPFVNERAAVSKGEGWGFINYQGLLEIPMQFEDVGNFNKQRDIFGTDISTAPARQGEKWGYISMKGKWLVPAEYDEVTEFDSDYARVRKGNKWFLINRYNKVMTPAGFDFIGEHLQGSYAVRNKRGRWGLTDAFGKIILPLKFDEIKITHRQEGVDKKETKVIYYRDGTQWFEFNRFAPVSSHKKANAPQ